ncbi:MAG: hypothetical protein JHD16_13610 [Solirubrobacteraceae bacterium]|nr:hypothetical protein [Solirubrobacteraceae bacterium]
MNLPFLKGRRAPDTTIEPVPQSAEVRRLREERLRLAELVAERTWDLGGLTYEMAVRDHFRVDVLARKAAELQELESQLSEIERLLANADGVGGSCRYCGSPHARGAAYCWRCGHPLGAPQRADEATHVVEAKPTVSMQVNGAPTATLGKGTDRPR